MPVYTFIDTNTEEVFDILISLSEYDEYKKQHPTHERHFDQAPAIVSGVSIKGKVADGFKEVISKITEAHPTSELAESHSRKSIKQIQTNEAIRKWRSTGGS
jgi:hypothetical protein